MSSWSEKVENVPDGGFEGVERHVIDRPPVWGFDDGFAKEIISEKTSLERIVDAHAVANLVTLFPASRQSPKPLNRDPVSQAVWRHRAI